MTARRTAPTVPDSAARDYRALQLLTKNMPFEERFWFKVQKTEGCWLWLGCRDKDGYGLVAVRRDGRQALRRAKRVAYELACGPIPDGLFVCHHCDNPTCVRPDHFFLGTVTDNQRDASRKGRLPQGSRHFRAKLTDSQVAEILAAYAAGDTKESLGRRFGVSGTTIARIVSRQHWRFRRTDPTSP